VLALQCLDPETQGGRGGGALAVVATLDTTLVSTIGGALVKGTRRLTYVSLVSAPTEVEGIAIATLVCIVDKTQVGATGADNMLPSTDVGTNGGAKLW